MKGKTGIILVLLLGSVAAVQAQPVDDPEREALQIAAMEALISAPEERALPLARKVLDGDYSTELKARALFVLSQIDMPEAQEALVAAAKTGEGELREEAVRMIGINGSAAALAELGELYRGGDNELREAVLQAYLIADHADAVYDLTRAGRAVPDGQSRLARPPCPRQFGTRRGSRDGYGDARRCNRLRRTESAGRGPWPGHESTGTGIVLAGAVGERAGNSLSRRPAERARAAALAAQCVAVGSIMAMVMRTQPARKAVANSQPDTRRDGRGDRTRSRRAGGTATGGCRRMVRTKGFC